MASVAVIDYGMGNLHSIGKALQHVAPKNDICITSDVDYIDQADRVVFPGVGAIADCVLALQRMELSEVVIRAAREKPFLGICLGLHALLEQSDENDLTQCLGYFPGKVIHFDRDLVDGAGDPLKIPHMGWNSVEQSFSHPMWTGIPQSSRFYFVHSYYAKPTRADHIAATADYPTAFACALATRNVFAVQFHPEKSQTAGLQLLKNFITWDGSY